MLKAYSDNSLQHFDKLGLGESLTVSVPWHVMGDVLKQGRKVRPFKLFTKCESLERSLASPCGFWRL